MRLRKALLIIAGSLVLLLAASVIIIDIYFLRNMRQRAEELLSRTLSAPVGIKALSLDLLRGLAVRGISVSNSGRAFVKADEIFVKYAPLELLNRGLAIKNISGRGLSLLLSDRTNDFIPLYKSLLSKFSNAPAGKPGLFHISLETVDVRDIRLKVKDRNYTVDRLTALVSSFKKKFEINVRDLDGVIGLKCGLSLSNRIWNIDADYRILNEPLSQFVSSGRLAAVISDFKSFTVTNTSIGPGLVLNLKAVIDPSLERIRVPEGRGALFYQGSQLIFSGQIQDMKRLYYDIKGTSQGLNARLLGSNFSGLVAFQGEVSGTAGERTFRIDSARIRTDDLSISGIFSNVLRVRNLDAVMVMNKVNSGTCLVDLGGSVHKISFSSGDIFALPLTADIKVRSDLLDVSALKLSGSKKGVTKKGLTNYQARLSFDCSSLKMGNQSLENVSISGTASAGNISDGKVSGAFKNAGISGTFESHGADLSAVLAFRNFNAGVFVPEMTTDMSCELNVRFELDKKMLSGTGKIRDKQVGFRGFEMDNFESGILIESNRFFLEKGKASFYQGTLEFSGSYDTGLKELNAEVKGANIDIETLINGYKSSSKLLNTFLPLETSTISGTASCDVLVKTVQSPDPLNAFTLTGKVDVKKGIVRDTLVQKQYSGVLGEVLNYFEYNDVALSLSVKNGLLKVDNLDLVSDELELHMTMDQNLKTGARNSVRKLMMSQDFVAQLNNIAQLPVSFFFRQEKKWMIVRQMEEKGKVSFVK